MSKFIQIADDRALDDAGRVWLYRIGIEQNEDGVWESHPDRTGWVLLTNKRIIEGETR